MKIIKKDGRNLPEKGHAFDWLALLVSNAFPELETQNPPKFEPASLMDKLSKVGPMIPLLPTDRRMAQ